jgi:hypothetical protein
LSPEEFVFRCQGPLAEPDRCCLRRLLHGQGYHCRQPFARHWYRTDRHLRLAIAQVRAGRIGVDMHPYMEKYRTLDPEIQRIVVDAFAKTNPLERERVIEEYRWKLLDELAAADAFGLAPILAFGLKLQIAERWANLDRTHGEETFQQHADDIMGQLEVVGT